VTDHQNCSQIGTQILKLGKGLHIFLKPPSTVPEIVEEPVSYCTQLKSEFLSLNLAGLKLRGLQGAKKMRY
jgi:hypothetical protein